MSVQASVSPGGRSIWLAWPDGRLCEIGARWLFDHAEGARDQVSGQRLHGGLDLLGSRVNCVQVEGDHLDAQFEPSGLRRRVRLSLFEESAPSEPAALWRAPEPVETAPPIAFDAFVMEDDVLRAALSRLKRFGLVLLRGAGSEPGTVERAVSRFGFVRETNYGRIFNVRIEAAPRNLAFSGRGLELHTDNPYRDPVPTLQLLHAMVADPEGGETLFVDGFAQAEALRIDHPEAFDLLTRTPARFRYADASGACWTAHAPVVELGPLGDVRTIRLNHRALDLPPGDAEATERWYDAYLTFYRQVHAPDVAFERTLRSGEMVIFDNRRILHGRRSLVGGSPRWLQGCYADSDGLWATLARLETSNPGRT